MLVQCQPSINSFPDVIPRPHRIELGKGIFELDDDSLIVITKNELRPLADLLGRHISDLSGINIKETA
jgi:hypothetical protein